MPSDIHYILKPSDVARNDLASARHRHLFERIKTTAAWKDAGLKVLVNKHGTLDQNAPHGEYRFVAVRRPSPGEEDAVRTGKRYVNHFFVLLDYERVGVPFDEFIAHPQHWRDYCTGVLAQGEGRLEDARLHLAAALHGNPNEVRYLEAWFQVRFDLDEESAAGEALVAFSDDMDAYADSMVLWIKLLVKCKLHTRGAAIAIRTDQLLGELAAGTRQRRHYGPQKPSYTAYQREKFRKQLTKLTASVRNRTLADEIERFGGLPNLS